MPDLTPMPPCGTEATSAELAAMQSAAGGLQYGIRASAYDDSLVDGFLAPYRGVDGDNQRITDTHVAPVAAYYVQFPSGKVGYSQQPGVKFPDHRLAINQAVSSLMARVSGYEVDLLGPSDVPAWLRWAPGIGWYLTGVQDDTTQTSISASFAVDPENPCATSTIIVASSAQFSIGQTLKIAGLFFTVTGKPTDTTLTVILSSAIDEAQVIEEGATVYGTPMSSTGLAALICGGVGECACDCDEESYVMSADKYRLAACIDGIIGSIPFTEKVLAQVMCEAQSAASFAAELGDDALSELKKVTLYCDPDDATKTRMVLGDAENQGAALGLKSTLNPTLNPTPNSVASWSIYDGGTPDWGEVSGNVFTANENGQYTFTFCCRSNPVGGGSSVFLSAFYNGASMGLPEVGGYVASGASAPPMVYTFVKTMEAGDTAEIRGRSDASDQLVDCLMTIVKVA